jgi:uncharacterized protein involved in response to NO
MNNFFTHPMRPFFVGAAILAIVGALSFFISPDDLILHRKIFLEFMLPAAYGGFLTASMLEWTNYKGNLKPIATILAALLLTELVLLPFSPQTASFLVAAYWLALLLFCAWLFCLDRNTDNFTLLMLLAAFMVCQTAYAITDSLKLLRAQVHLNMAAVMFVSIRVSILLGAEALKESTLKDPVFIPNVVIKISQLHSCCSIPLQNYGCQQKLLLLLPLPLALSCLPSYANYIITNCYVNITYALIIPFNCSPRLAICGLA